MTCTKKYGLKLLFLYKLNIFEIFCKKDLLFSLKCSIISFVVRRGVAQFGRVPEWGSGGRWFESSHSDHVGASYISLALIFLQKIRVLSCRCFSLFAKGHVRIVYSFASARVTPLAHYQPFARVPSALKI